MLIRAYRIRGHLAADLDPLGMRDRDAAPRA
jgi:2-oxoglutarate dehydrogenase E1 component